MKRLISFHLILVLITLTFVFHQPSYAQNNQTAWPTVELCSTVDYATVFSEAVGLTPAEIRNALLSTGTLSDLAQHKNVDLRNGTLAVMNAHLSLLDQAVQDSQVDAQLAQQIRSALQSYYTSDQRNNGAYNGQVLPLPDISPYSFQAVRILPIAAAVIQLNCFDMVQRLIADNQSLVAIVTTQGGSSGGLVDSILEAYQTALEQDVKDQLLTASQAKGLRVQLAQHISVYITQVGAAVLSQAATIAMGSINPPNPYNNGPTLLTLFPIYQPPAVLRNMLVPTKLPTSAPSPTPKH